MALFSKSVESEEKRKEREREVLRRDEDDIINI